MFAHVLGIFWEYQTWSHLLQVNSEYPFFTSVQDLGSMFAMITLYRNYIYTFSQYTIKAYIHHLYITIMNKQIENAFNKLDLERFEEWKPYVITASHQTWNV